jgi:hypothetical protein
MESHKFRFQQLDIWKRSALVSGPFLEIADTLEQRKKFRWAEQLRAATLSITNNIAEGSGVTTKPNLPSFSIMPDVPLSNAPTSSFYSTTKIIYPLHPTPTYPNWKKSAA